MTQPHPASSTFRPDLLAGKLARSPGIARYRGVWCISAAADRVVSIARNPGSVLLTVDPQGCRHPTRNRNSEFTC